MRYSLQVIFLLVSFSIIISGQVPRTVLMEYATNASCPPCAAYNPDSYSYLKNNYNQIVAIWYHAWWPGSNDPMYLSNIEENRNRIEFYGVNSVPTFIVDGVFIDNPGDYSKLQENVESRLQIESPVDLRISTNINNDSININIDLIVYVDVSEPNLVLRTAIIEQMLEYELPPGSNGESKFPHVFREFIGGIEGIKVSNLSAGDSLNFRLSHEMSPDWDIGKVAVVTFIQSEDTKEVIQAGSNLKFHEIISEAPKVEIVNKNQTINHEYNISNTQEDTLNIQISLNELVNNEAWENDLIFENIRTKSFKVKIEPAKSIKFNLEINTKDISDHISLKISALNINEDSQFISEIEYMSLLSAGDILLIDDDGGAEYEENFIRPLNYLKKDYTKIEYEILNKFNDLLEISENFNVVLWNIGEHSPSLEPSDITFMMDYLNNGGRALFSGSDFAHDIHDVQNLSAGKFFFRNYLDATYLTDSVSSTSLETVEGNPLFETDITMQINPIYSTLPDGVTSGKGQSYLTLKYDDTLHYGMLTRELNEYKTAYLTCGLEQIASVDDQNLIIEKVLDWFNKPVVGVKENESTVLPAVFEIEQNFPNPFNPSTTIRFALPKSTFVSISVFNCLGEKVSELMNSEMNAGFHSINFNAESLSSGIYFYRIIADEYIATKKMLLLK